MGAQQAAVAAVQLAGESRRAAGAAAVAAASHPAAHHPVTHLHQAAAPNGSGSSSAAAGNLPLAALDGHAFEAALRQCPAVPEVVAKTLTGGCSCAPLAVEMCLEL